jgi:DNA-binding XRE family transcriptional regulator
VRASPEVEQFLVGLYGLDDADAEAAVKRLKREGNNLRMPHSRSLGDKVFELRFVLTRSRNQQLEAIMTTQNWRTTDEIFADKAAHRTPQEQAEHERLVADAMTRQDMAAQVYQMRVDSGLTQTELARRLGVTQPMISAIERGAKAPTIATLSRIAEATGHHMRIEFPAAA